MTTTSRPITACQICGSDQLRSVLWLGAIPPVNTMPAVGSTPEESVTYPLELIRCDACTLVQIGLEVDPDILFPPSYPYRSASTKILRENFAQLAEESIGRLGLSAGDRVVDIGSNDGTLLAPFQERGMDVLGIEPSLAAEDANARGIRTHMTFFSREVGEATRRDEGPAKLVTAANVFAHIPAPDEIVAGIVALLDDDGVFISESHYLLSLIETLQYDTVYHEHLRYYSLRALSTLLERGGLEVFDAVAIPTHGGSIRVYAARAGQREVQPSVAEFLAREDAAGLTDGSVLESFRKQVATSKLDLLALLAGLRRDGARVYGVGAPSRASTLINYVGLDEASLDCVLEVSTSNKVNRYIPGTRVPVLDEAILFTDQPEYALLLSWHISDELIGNLRRKGFTGKFIVPLPEPHVVDA